MIDQNIPANFPFGQPIAWYPNPDWILESNLQRFMTRHRIDGFDTLIERSTDEMEWFWNAVLEDLGIEFYEPYEQVVDLKDGFAFPRWCVGGKINIIHNCLDKWKGTDVWHSAALRFEAEDGSTSTLTYAELNSEVNRCLNGLRSVGFKRGDCVGLFMPMIPELAIAFLSVIKGGGIVLPLFSGYGPSAISTRLADAGAAYLITADGSSRRGKTVEMKPVADAVIEQVPSIRQVIVVNNLGSSSMTLESGRDRLWHELLSGQSLDAETVRTDAEDLLMIIYTSGTTGKPKGALHTHCGFPVKAAQDMFHCMDVKRGDTMYWMTDMGWMMGPWEVFGTLLVGASMVFYDGAPDYPSSDRTWQMVERHKISHLGVSPTFVRAIRSHADAPGNYDFTSLRAACSTGSPWDPDSWMWFFRTILGGTRPILNYSGGTEISGGIVCGNFFKPLKPCAFSGPVPGMAADVVDDRGNPIRGAVGELVIRKPWIGMTRGFWKEPDRYLEAYWNRFENTWVHGDFAAVDEDGLWYILGRSDDTIKVSGKRIGPAEVESILNAHPLVRESAAIGIPDDVKGQEIVAFCVLEKDSTPSSDLREELVNLLVRELGKPLRPREIRFTTALPKTRNAKVMHRIIQAAYLDNDLGDLTSIEDPSSVEAIRLSQ